MSSVLSLYQTIDSINRARNFADEFLRDVYVVVTETIDVWTTRVEEMSVVNCRPNQPQPSLENFNSALFRARRPGTKPPREPHTAHTPGRAFKEIGQFSGFLRAEEERSGPMKGKRPSALAVQQCRVSGGQVPFDDYINTTHRRLVLIRRDRTN